jgi:hypothetical protein
MKVKIDLSSIGLHQSVELRRDQKKLISEMINKIIGSIRDTERAKKLAVDQNIDSLVNQDQNECMQLCQELLEEIKEVATTDDPKFVYNLLTTCVREKNAEMEIDEEFKLLHLKMHQQMIRGGVENRTDRDMGPDPTFSWDTTQRQDWQPVYKPVCYIRTIDGVETFIPNVRTMMMTDNGKMTGIPASYHPNKSPHEEYVEIQVPCTSIELKEQKEVYTTITEEVTETKFIPRDTTTGLRSFTIANKQTGFFQHIKVMKNGIHVTTKRRVKKVVNKMIENGTKKITILSKGGWPFQGSKEVGPPAKYEDGKATNWVCYADSSADRGAAYTMIGPRWENMRKRFLNDVHDGNVNICQKIEKDNNGKRVVKYQAYKVYPNTVLKFKDGTKATIDMLLFCDIQSLRSSDFVNGKLDNKSLLSLAGDMAMDTILPHEK